MLGIVMFILGIVEFIIDPAICKALALLAKVFVMFISMLGIDMFIEEGI